MLVEDELKAIKEKVIEIDATLEHMSKRIDNIADITEPKSMSWAQAWASASIGSVIILGCSAVIVYSIQFFL